MHSHTVALVLLAISLTVTSAFRIPSRVNASAACADGTKVCLWSGPILPRSEVFNDTSSPLASSTHGDITKRDEHNAPWAFEGDHEDSTYSNGTTTTESERHTTKHYMQLTSLGDIPVSGHNKPPRMRPTAGASSRKHAPKVIRSVEQVLEAVKYERKLMKMQRQMERQTKEETAHKDRLDGVDHAALKTEDIKTPDHHEHDLSKRDARNTLQEDMHHADTSPHGKQGLMDSFMRRQILTDHHERHARLDQREKTKDSPALS